jgi:hypothetical protein
LTQHTPGPWTFKAHKQNADVADVFSGVPRGRFSEVGVAVNVNTADARLIAAAPEMYDLLRRMNREGCFDGLSAEWGHEARALLAKIEGKS